MKNFIKTFLTDTSGAAAAEYVLILMIIGTTLVVGVGYLGDAIGTALTNAGEAIEGVDFSIPDA